MFDIGKLIGGPDEGDGLVGALLGVFALGGGVAAMGAGDGIFDGIGGASMDAGFSTAASGFGETAGWGLAESGGIARWFGSLFENASFIDYIFAFDIGSDFFSSRGRAVWGALSEETKQMVAAHGFIRQQLQEQGLEALAEKYRALGTNLPDEKLLKEVFHGLAKKLHTDTNPLDAELMKTLNAAKDRIADPRKARAYEGEMMFNRGGVEDLLNELDTNATSWAQKYEASTAAQAQERIAKGHLLEDAAADTRGAEGGFKHWIGSLSNGQKTGLVFAGVATVGLGVVLGMKIAEHRRTKKSHQPAFGQIGPNKVVDSVSVVDRVHSNEPNLFAQHRS